MSDAEEWTKLGKAPRPFTPAELEELIKKIDPETAELTWGYANVVDPYGMTDDEMECIGIEYFVIVCGRAVAFTDLPDELDAALREKHLSTSTGRASFQEVVEEYG
jgi:hypothetical protein